MRILKIELENINSLKGTWSIDFTDPAYARNHDIFVIHGPTGAGKTTLLDAITLALYGRTPRLEAVNDGVAGNELMTRGTGMCRATVTYQCKRGVFTSTFQQNRANGRASGRLQIPSYQIVKDDGTVFDTGKSPRALAEKTQEIIQLDYDQFCRSIMLAQGEFSRFLKSTSRERAQILEKLTGTGRYRQIAQAVHARFSDLDRRFDSVKEEKERMEKLVLTEDAEKELNAKADSLQSEYNAAEKELSRIQKDITSYDTLEKLEQGVKSAQLAVEKSAREASAFSDDERRLLRAESARDCAESFASFSALRTADERDRAASAASEKERDALSVSAKEAASREAEAAERFSALEKELVALRSVWTGVRALDVQISAAEKTSADAVFRRKASEKALSEAESALAALSEAISVLAAEKTALDSYIAGHAIDETLPEIIARAETLSASVKEHADKRMHLQLELDKAEKDAVEAALLSEKANAELSEIEEAIQAFVSKESLFIVRELQKQLTAGNPCPVCGVPYKTQDVGRELPAGSAQPAADGEQAAASREAEKSRELALSSAELSSRYEEAEARALQAQKKAEAASSALELLKSRLSETESAVAASLSQIQDALSPWNVTVSEETVASALALLRKQSALWQQKQAGATENARLTAEKEAARASHQQQLTERSEELASLTEAEQHALSEEASLRDRRRAMFGEKDVDAEEREKNDALQEAKRLSDMASERFRTEKESLARVEAQLEQLTASVSERQEKLSSAQSAFQKRLSANGIADEEAYLAARMDEQEFSALQNRRDAIKRAQVQAEAALAEAVRSHDDYKAHASLTTPKETLLTEQNEVLVRREQAHVSLVDVQMQLKTNDDNRENARRVERDYDAIQKEHALWKQMKDFVGVKSGDDFSEFVQSIAFNRLLFVTNKNLYGITGRYRIVQKTPGSLDFAIDDAYCTDVRSVSNLSGGEQFLVSLSLALGISEFASHAVRVDSLFLDEGFGTLSGDLLTEAINALKNLQKDGKMLGIITHVDTVIHEIDQRIEVRQTTGGHSVLIGAGITGPGASC
ncbi:MAG: AAA family ATPase [Treponema sp.]|nr:AAA family ATPase [Treponema sp.]